MNYRQSVKELAEELGSDLEKGLSIEKAHGRIHSRGRNMVRVPKKINTFVGMSKYIFSLMNIILAVMAVVYIFADGGRQWYLSLLFLACAVINAVAGCISFRRDSSPIKTVNSVQYSAVKVLRSGIEKTIPAMLMAQGDVFFLEAGQIVPADARIIECSGAVVDESILSGDGGSVTKSADPGQGDDAAFIYMGSRVLSGTIKAIATALGDNTQLGSTMGILSHSDEKRPSLARKLSSIGNIFSALAALMWLAALLIRLSGGYGVESAFNNSLSAALAVLPITLPILVLLTVSIDILRLRGKGIDLHSTNTVENLGASTLLCVGKRGTLTEQGFGVGAVKPGNGLEANYLRRLAALCTTVDVGGDIPVGDPMQVALVKDALANGCTVEDIRTSAPLVKVLDNHRENRLMTTVHKVDNGYLVICKGAPDAVAACCGRIYDNGIRPFDKSIDLANIIGESNHMADDALSVMAVAYCDTMFLPEEDGYPGTNMVFAGLVGLSNPIRPNTVASVKQLRSMGVRTCLITNENLTTAIAVARQSGIPTDTVVQGANVDCVNVALLRKTSVFADIGAKLKADIVAAMNAEKENVITVGRGARDINAMNFADVSVTTDAGAKVCSAAADVKIKGSGMEPIAFAVRECKRSFFNIERMIGYLLICSVAQAVCIISSLVAGYSAPFSPLGIIWLEFAVSALAAIGIWCEPYHRRPVKKTELNNMKSGRVATPILLNSIVRGVLVGAAAMAVYSYCSGRYDIYQRRGAVLLILSLGLTFIGQSCRSGEPLYKRLIKNPVSLVCLALDILICFLTFNSASLCRIFELDRPSGNIAAICVAAAIAPMLIVEVIKLITSSFGKKTKHKKQA